MARFKFVITEEEKNRILSLHRGDRKNTSFITEEMGLQKSDFPRCIQLFGDPTPSSDGKYGGIDGGNVDGIKYNWTGYRFFSNFRVRKPDDSMASYFCKGDQPVLGQKIAATKGSKTTSADLGGKILKIGSSGEAVKMVQSRVCVGGHGDCKKVGGPNCGEKWQDCDGKFGQTTKDAVKKFQQSAGVTDDGIVGDETWQQLFGGEAPPPEPASPPPPPPPPTQTTSNTPSEHERMTKNYGIGYK